MNNASLHRKVPKTSTRTSYATLNLNMSVSHFKAASPSSFASALQSAKSKAAALSAPLFIHVRADWCPDCTRTDGTISSAFSALDSPAVVLTALVDDRAAYRTPTFPYRTDDTLKIRAIPTLMKVSGDKLVEAECGDPRKVAKLVGVDENLVGKAKSGCCVE